MIQVALAAGSDPLAWGLEPDAATLATVVDVLEERARQSRRR